MKKIKLLGFLMVALASSLSFAQKAKNLKMYIKPNTVSCTGVAPMECMQVKLCNEKQYNLFYDKIEGFNYEKGYEYKLKVKRTEVANPAADASKYKYQLKRVISKKAVVVESFVNQKMFLSELNGKNIETKNVYVTLDLNTNTLYGNSGCNHFNIAIEKDKKGLYHTKSGIGTLMACDEAVMKLEQEFMTALQDKKFKIKQTENKVVFENQNKETIVFSIPTTHDILSFIDGKNWKLIQLENVSKDYDKAFITFDVKNNRVNGNAGCNNFFGGFSVKEDKISFSQLGMTRMACPNEKGDVENKVVKYLNAMDLRFDVADQTLNIYQGDRLVLMFAISQ